MRLKADIGVLLASDKIDWTSLRQGTALRLPETGGGNIIFHSRLESYSLIRKPEQRQISISFLASTEGQQRHLSHSATPDPGQPC